MMKRAHKRLKRASQTHQVVTDFKRNFHPIRPHLQLNFGAVNQFNNNVHQINDLFLLISLCCNFGRRKRIAMCHFATAKTHFNQQTHWSKAFINWPISCVCFTNGNIWRDQAALKIEAGLDNLWPRKTERFIQNWSVAHRKCEICFF